MPAFYASTSLWPARRLNLAAVRRKLASRKTLSIDDLIHLTRDTVTGITKTQDAFALEGEALAQIRAAGFYPLLIDVPPDSNDDHWRAGISVTPISPGGQEHAFSSYYPARTRDSGLHSSTMCDVTVNDNTNALWQDCCYVVKGYGVPVVSLSLRAKVHRSRKETTCATIS